MYDTGDTINSYIGEPTTNYQWNGGSEVTPWTVGGINTDVTNTVNQGPIKGAKTWKFQKTGTSNQWNGWESSYGGIWSGNSGDIWTTSYWYKTNNDAGMGGFWIGAFYTPDWSRPYNTTVLANVSSIIPDGQWHYNYTVTRFNENYSNAIIVDGPSWGYSGQAGELYVNGLQWEKKSHPTPFAYGTRSATQGLLPLISNSTIDLSNVSFDSNAQIIWDGTDDTLSVTETYSHKPGLPFTYEIIVTPLGTDNGYDKMLLGKPGWHTGIMYQNGYTWFRTRYGNPAFYDAGWYLLSPESYYHLTAVYIPGTSMKFYVNGILNGENNSVTSPLIDIGNTLNIGGSSTNYSCYVKIPIAKVYNRALSATEIKQNYNKYKSRFNLS
jgi:hypothetical protein